jgi:intein/homing endonuclease
VIADDPTTPGGIEARQVLDTFVRETDALVDLYVDGEVISTTGEHPFWVPDKGWVEAKDLTVGSLLQTGDGRVVDVDKVEKREGLFQVYNFRVEGIPTYFVSDLGVLVHNTCDPSAPNAGLENLPMHRKRTRFYAKASELTVEDNVIPLHPINPEQLLGSERVGHAGVRNLSNEELLRFGGPQGDDPIQGFREHKITDDLGFPGSEIHIRGGHHRISEIARRVRAGELDPNTLVEFLIP